MAVVRARERTREGRSCLHHFSERRRGADRLQRRATRTDNVLDTERLQLVVPRNLGEAHRSSQMNDLTNDFPEFRLPCSNTIVVHLEALAGVDDGGHLHQSSHGSPETSLQRHASGQIARAVKGCAIVRGMAEPVAGCGREQARGRILPPRLAALLARFLLHDCCHWNLQGAPANSLPLAPGPRLGSI